jgi:hypothetical protein
MEHKFMDVEQFLELYPTYFMDVEKTTEVVKEVKPLQISSLHNIL